MMLLFSTDDMRTDDAISLCQQSKRFRFWVHRLNIIHYNYLNIVTRTLTKRGVQFVYNIQPAESFPKIEVQTEPPAYPRLQYTASSIL